MRDCYKKKKAMRDLVGGILYTRCMYPMNLQLPLYVFLFLTIKIKYSDGKGSLKSNIDVITFNLDTYAQ